MTNEKCGCGEPIAFCKHLGTFSSYEEKAAFYFNWERTQRLLNEGVAASKAKTLALMAQQLGLAGMLPTELRDALKFVCDGADKLDDLPMESVLAYAKIAGVVAKTICSVTGVK
jgi:hypothetical protein